MGICVAIGVAITVNAWAQSAPQNALRLNDEGNAASDAIDYATAAVKYKEASELWRSLGPEYRAHLAGTLMNLGSVLCGLGKRAEGATAFVEALALHRQTLGPRHHRTVMNMTLLASDYLMLGELAKAEAILDEALPIARADFPSDIQTARCLEIQSGVLNRHGKLAESVVPAEEALSVAIRVAGEDGLETALAYATAAEAHRANGRNDRALPLYRKAHALYEKTLGPEHPRAASLWGQEGLIEMQDGKLSTAERSMQKSISLLNKSCPNCWVELAVAYNNLGLLRLAQKRWAEADESLTRSMELREKFSSVDSMELASSIESLAYARKMLHRDADADRLAKRAAGMMSNLR
jgi:tetratricopeptide (TPR) repeat protein